MADGAKWIKIATETFEDEKIDIIEGMPSGDKMIIIWFKLLLLAGKCNAGGYLLLQEDIPFNKDMLARRFKQEISVIELALGVFQRYKMIQITDRGIYITNFNKHQDLDKMNLKRTQDRERKQRQREKEKLLAESEQIKASEQDIVPQNKVINIKQYIEFFNSNFHQITEYEASLLSSYEKQGMNPQVITLALKEATLENARDLRYVKKILDRWYEKNILTVEAVMEDKAEFKRKKHSNKINSKKNNQKTSTFNNYSQREYDYEVLEKQLLGW